MADIDKGITLNPKHAEYYRGCSHVSVMANRLDRAISCANRALELEPDNPKSYHSRGCVLSEKGDYRSAISDFDKSAMLSNNNEQKAVTYIDLAQAYYHLKQYDRAKIYIMKARELNPALTNDFSKWPKRVTFSDKEKRTIPEMLSRISKIQ